MKRAKTIIKQINKLQEELYDNYTDEEIVKAIENLKDNYGTCIDMIYEGCYNDIMISKMEEENNE